MLGWMFGCLLVAAPLAAQISWNTVPVPPNQGAMAFDSWRQRLLSIGNGAFYEFDGTSWLLIQPYLGSPGWLAFDDWRGRTVFTTSTWPPSGVSLVTEWDGTSWSSGVVLPPSLGNPAHVTPGGSLGIVLAYTYPTIQGLALYSWNGSFFTLLPAGVPPPTLVGGGNYYRYHSMTFERTTGKVVLFGRSEHAPSGGTVARVPITWEWDATNGWVNLGTSGTLTGDARIWFDQHRGKVMRLDGQSGIPTAYSRTASGGWASFPLQAPSIILSPTVIGYDSLKNRYYGIGASLGYYADVNPAAYEYHASSCLTFPNVSLDLTLPWTRAWIGGTLSVDIGLNAGSPLPTPYAFLAMGFNDQSFGGQPLPLSLASIGMPTCALHVDAQVTLPASVVPGGVGTVAIPIPFNYSLVGLPYFQQAFAAVPGANPANVLASRSMRGLIGASQ